MKLKGRIMLHFFKHVKCQSIRMKELRIVSAATWQQHWAIIQGGSLKCLHWLHPLINSLMPLTSPGLWVSLLTEASIELCNTIFLYHWPGLACKDYCVMQIHDILCFESWAQLSLFGKTCRFCGCCSLHSPLLLHAERSKFASEYCKKTSSGNYRKSLTEVM